MLNKKWNIQKSPVELRSRIVRLMLCSRAFMTLASEKIAAWRRSSLGLLYYPNYIHNATAIHGSVAMAVYPASHGCIRIPMFAAKELSELTPVGTEVVIYD